MYCFLWLTKTHTDCSCAFIDSFILVKTSQLISISINATDFHHIRELRLKIRFASENCCFPLANFSKSNDNFSIITSESRRYYHVPNLHHFVVNNHVNMQPKGPALYIHMWIWQHSGNVCYR